MIDAHNSITRMRIRELMDVRLQPGVDPMLLPGVCWLVAHGFSESAKRTVAGQNVYESRREFTSHGRKCWVTVMGRKPRKNVRWSATVVVYGNQQERDLADSLEPFHSLSADMAVGVQIARLDELLNEYDKKKENEHGNKDS